MVKKTNEKDTSMDDMEETKEEELELLDKDTAEVSSAEMSDSAPAPDKGNEQKIKKLIWIVVGGIAVLLAIFIAVAGVGMYRWGWDNNFTEGLVKVIPYPVATVNGENLTIKDLDFKVATLGYFYGKQKEKDPTFQVPTKDQLRKNILETMIVESLVRQEARKRHIVVTQDDINTEMKKLADQLKASNKSEDEIDSTLKDLYNWTRDQFIAQVLKPFVLRDKLDKAISGDEAEIAKAKAKASEALAKVKSGTDFADVAKQYSEDTLSQAQGGDLGWFGKGEMVPDFENAVFALKVGEVSDLVKTSYGFHIIKLTDKRTQKVDGKDVEQVRASHILIRTKSITDWLDEARKSAKVTYWISSLKPDATTDTNQPAPTTGATSPTDDQNVNAADTNVNQPADNTNKN